MNLISFIKELPPAPANGSHVIELSFDPEPAASGTVGGSLHRAWTNIKSSIAGIDEQAVLAECERGEDVAKCSNNILKDLVNTGTFDRIDIVSEDDDALVAHAYRGGSTTPYVFVIHKKIQPIGALRRSEGRVRRSLSKEQDHPMADNEQASITEAVTLEKPKEGKRDPFLEWIIEQAAKTDRLPQNQEYILSAPELTIQDASAPEPTPYDPAAIAAALGASSSSK